MVHDRRSQRAWVLIAAVGLALGLVLADPAVDSARPQPATSPARQTSDPSASAAIHTDAARIATALEAKNAYEKSPEAQKDADEAATAARNAASWALGLLLAGIAETAVTAAGVILVYHTLREAKRSADEAKRGADEMKRSADATAESAGATKIAAEATLRALARPWLYIDVVDHIVIDTEPNVELRYAKAEITNYGNAPGILVSARAVLFLNPRPGTEDALEKAIGYFPDTMRRFPQQRGEVSRFIFNEGKSPFNYVPGEVPNYTPVPFGNGIVLRQDGKLTLYFEADRAVDMGAPDGPLKLEHLGAFVYLLGNVVYTMPTGEIETLTFCFEAKRSRPLPFLAVGGRPYNGRERHDPRPIGGES